MPSGRHTESARDGVGLCPRRQVGGGSCRFARSWPMAAECRRELGRYSAILTTTKLKNVMMGLGLRGFVEGRYWIA